jgi:signal transduction histidine kinase
MHDRFVERAHDGSVTAVSLPAIRRLTRFDVALVVAVIVLTTVGTALLPDGRSDGLWPSLLLAAVALPLLARRDAPRAALAATLLLALLYDLLDGPGPFYTLPIAIALFSAVDAGVRWTAVGATAITVGGFLALGIATGRGHVTELGNALWFAGWLVASLVLGEVTRSRREVRREAEERALAAERRREEEERRRAGEERMRIARELHDILGHRISLINVQASAAVHVIDRDPERARTALVAIKEASHEALGEIRATLGILRQLDEHEPLAPAPGLAELDTVIAETSASGLDVQLDVRGEARRLPGGVELAAYRIIQESLTNVVRHARATRARIGLDYRATDLEIEVVDDGTPPVASDARSGSGIIGMGERARALGGELDAGPRPGGGFRVHARLPLDGVT